MKEKLLTICTVVLIGVLLVLLQSCKKDDAVPAPDDREVFKSKIARTWKVKTVTVDAVDVTIAFPNMMITFNGDQSYTATNAVSPIWPTSGSFEIVPANNGQYYIKRSDGVAITIISLTDTSMTLELTYTPPNARVVEVSGNYRFELGL